jgi:hypothetical protein
MEEKKKHTDAEEADVPKLLPSERIRDPLGDQFDCPCRDQKDAQPEGHGMEKELVHDDVNHHHNSELSEEEDAYESGVLRASLDSKDTVQKRRNE